MPFSAPLMMACVALCAGAMPGQAWGQSPNPTSPIPTQTPRAMAAPVPLLVPLLVPPAAAVRAPTPSVAGVPTVITATPEYCASLGGRVGDMAREAKAPAEAADLAREGQRLCEDGKTRSGILHLRRAFILLRQPGEER